MYEKHGIFCERIKESHRGISQASLAELCGRWLEIKESQRDLSGKRH
jgi:hypothetical protein